MASTLARRRALEREETQQRQLLQRQIEQINKQQDVLDVQFRRLVEIQGELDLVQATVRLAAPTIAAASLNGLRDTATVSVKRALAFARPPQHRPRTLKRKVMPCPSF